VATGRCLTGGARARGGTCRVSDLDGASVTEQTDAWVGFDLTADDLAALMQRLCNVDFAIVPDGHATRTVMEHLGVYLIKRGKGAARIYGPRSSAESLLHAVEAAAVALA